MAWPQIQTARPRYSSTQNGTGSTLHSIKMRASVRDLLISKENLEIASLDIMYNRIIESHFNFLSLLLQRWVGAFLGGGVGGFVGLGVADVVDAALLLHVLRPPQPDARQPAAGRLMGGLSEVCSDEHWGDIH